MKLSIRAFLIGLMCLLIVPAALAKKPGTPAPSITGVYENFTVGKGSGDLEGMRVILLNAGNEYHAIVQVAQGGAEDPKPEWVSAEVKGHTVTFSVGDRKYSGTVTVAGLRLKAESGVTEMLRRKPCSSFL